VHCHAPLREQLAEVHRGGGPLADEGITCAACHVRGGRIIARVRSPASPHDTDARADFGSPSFCAGCHQFNFPRLEDDPTHAGPGRVVGYTAHPMQDTVHQHARGPFAAAPCLTCHAAGDGGHLFPGGHDPGMLARAATVEACRAGRLLELRVTNAGAGHNLPTGDLHRHLVLRAWRASAPERLHETILGRRFAPAEDGGKTTIADDTLPPGTTHAVRLSPGALGPRDGRDEPISIELRLVYTIDELPFRGRELAEPTYATMLTRELPWPRLPACRRASPPPSGQAPRAPSARAVLPSEGSRGRRPRAPR
jgi:hypothetical protein